VALSQKLYDNVWNGTRLRALIVCIRETVIALSRKYARQDSAGHIVMQAEQAPTPQRFYRGSYPHISLKNFCTL
jgi:hypothetical protein